MAEPIRSYRRLGGRTLAILISSRLKFFILFIIFFGGLIWAKGFVPVEYSAYADLIVNPTVVGIAILIGFFLLGFSLLSGWLEYIHYTIAISANGLVVKRGVLTQKERSVPYRRIQEVKLHRTPFDLTWGVSTVVIDLLGDNDGEPIGEDRLTLTAVGKDLAEEIRDELLKRAQVEQITVHPGTVK